MRKDIKILLTNDDGLKSNGMKHLEEALREFGDVWAVAPDRERSATSQAISIRETLRMTAVNDRHFMVNGFPADCVNVAFYSGRFPRFDLVVSGINHGENLGDDLHYSGTVGAARHAAIHGIKAVSISCPVREHDGNFYRVALWLRLWLNKNFDLLEKGIVYNINYPKENAKDIDDEFPESAWALHGRRQYVDQYEAIEETGNSTIFKLKETVLGFKDEKDTDFYLVNNGKISITPVSIQTTHREEL
ncbi:MAG: 5'/3'-nucleotidase SurE, partial [Spirochaetia bacterium]|nr:5'/3'-nucleotidase SurE [Spirochaetia bacterium]